MISQLPEFVWSEEYQVETMSRHFEAFDKLRAQGFFIGEFIWNFADFRTAQSTSCFSIKSQVVSFIGYHIVIHFYTNAFIKPRFLYILNGNSIQ
jgi:hypothetical protein